MTDGKRSLAEIRAEQLAPLGDAIYLNAASITPLPARSAQATRAFNDRRASVHTMTEADFLGPPRRARDAVAELINADPSEIALGDNTSFGINLVAAGIDIPPGSSVIVSDREFPANVYPWMHRGYRLEQVPVDPHGWPDVDRMLGWLAAPEVRVFSISSVQFSNGYRADLDRIGAACRDNDVLLVVDAIQSLGVAPINVRDTPVDVVAAGGHKWLCGPLGVGFCYVRREVQERIRPVNVGWSSMKASQDLDNLLDYHYDFVGDARRFEVATAPLQDYVAFAESVTMLNEIGVTRIAEHVEEILSPIREWVQATPGAESVTPGDASRRAGIFSLRLPDAEGAFARLRAAGITCSLREGAIRLAPHFYNTIDEIRAVVEVLEEGRVAGWK